MAKSELRSAKRIYFLVSVFVLFSLALLAVGAFMYRYDLRRHRTEIERELSAIAELKVVELQQWRRERFADAENIFGNTSLMNSVRNYLNSISDIQSKQTIEEWLRQYTKHFDFNQFRLLDLKGETHLSVPSQLSPVSATVIKQIREVVKTKRIEFVDLYRHDYDHRVYMSVLIPVLDKSDGDRVIGVIALRVDPEKYFYPIILRWPTPSRTAETLIVRRDGNDALFLNELRFIKNAALNLRVPLTTTNVAAVMAVNGRTGIVDAIDYRNVPVIADVRPVPESPWFLVTRMDKSEIYSEVRLTLWLIVAVIFALILGFGATLAFLWRKERIALLQKQAQVAEELRESESLVRSIGNNMPNCMMYQLIRSKDGTRRFSFVSEAVRKFYGCSPQEAMADPNLIYGRVFKEDLRRLLEAEEAAFKAVNSFVFEIRIMDPSGKMRWSSLASSPRRMADGSTHWDGIEIDITPRKLVETELLSAKNEAEEAVRSKSKFMDIAAHELRNPITAISLLLEVYQKQLEKGQALSPSMVTRLGEPVQRLNRLVADLMEVSRLERGMIALQPVRTNLTALISSCLDEFRLKAPKRSFKFQKPEQQMEIHCDPIRINQVLSNLLDNAIKYTPAESSIEVTIELMSKVVRVSVVDHGPGIPEDQLRNIFSAFSRGDSEATVQASGLGLGLAISRGIVELHGGKIGVLSEVGRGSTFCFELPR